MRRTRRVPLVAVVACLIATAVGISLLAWHAQRAEEKNASREAAVRQALPVVEAAIDAALAEGAADSLKAELERNREAGPGAYREFVTVDRPEVLQSRQWGHDFAWRGKRYRWPENPYTGRPMKEGTGPGDFSILFIWYGYVTGQPDAFELTGYGNDGKPVVTLTESPSGIPVQP